MTHSRFFCENCGTEVRPHAKVCPKCGRFFSAVRCPQCGYTGEGKEFFHGCPNCGYSGGGLRGGGRGAGREEWYDAAELEMGVDESPQSRRERGRAPRRRNPPPGWVYWLALGLVTLAFVIMVVIYVNIS